MLAGPPLSPFGLSLSKPRSSFRRRRNSASAPAPRFKNTREQPDGPLVLHIFTGADASFSLYEDDGVSPAYLQGQYARVPIRWNQATRTLTIGAREGGYAGMPEKRAISVRFYGPGKAVAPDFAENAATRVVYAGKVVSVRKR